VGGKLYVFTMSNTAYIFDVNTGLELAKPSRKNFWLKCSVFSEPAYLPLPALFRKPA
jgi:hypothetical protein